MLPTLKQGPKISSKTNSVRPSSLGNPLVNLGTPVTSPTVAPQIAPAGAVVNDAAQNGSETATSSTAFPISDDVLVAIVLAVVGIALIVHGHSKGSKAEIAIGVVLILAALGYYYFTSG